MIKIYGKEISEDEARMMLRELRERTGAQDLKDAIQLAFCDEEFYLLRKNMLKTVKMLYSASLDAVTGFDVISLYPTA